MRIRIAFLLIVTITVVGFKHYNDSNDRKDFSLKLSEAKSLLAKSPAGLRALHQIGPYGIYSSPISINAWSGSEISEINGSSGGAIAPNSNEQFEIFVNKSFNSVQIAHILAHEAKHIEDEKERTKVLNQFGELKKDLDQVAFNMYEKQSLSELLPTYQKEINYVLQSLFCTEYRAHLINRELHQSGLKLEHPANTDDLIPYIERRYISRFGIKLKPSLRTNIVKTCAKYKSFARYQEVLLEEIFDIRSKKIASSGTKSLSSNNSIHRLLAFEFEESEDMDTSFDKANSNLPQFSKEQDPNMPELEKIDESLSSKSHITSRDNIGLKKNDSEVEQIDLASEIQSD